jgi:hypothetical protein
MAFSFTLPLSTSLSLFLPFLMLIGGLILMIVSQLLGHVYI